MDISGVKNIIFDLGGVLLNIDYNNTSNAFRQLGFPNFDAMYSQFKADQLFEKLERGAISEADFFTVLQQVADKPVNAAQITDAWCAMLLDFRKESLEKLKELSTKYRIYLLSNTNSIHQQAFYTIFDTQFGTGSLNGYFTKAYYSHELGLRKPDTDIYEFVLEDAGLVAAETFFIDDSWINLGPAEALGIRTHLLLPGQRIEHLFP